MFDKVTLFERPCASCNGRGTKTYYVQEGLRYADCWVCRGSGRELTDVGEQLASFLKARGIQLSEPAAIEEEE